MSYQEKAKRIRSKLSRYTTNSIFNEVLRNLIKPEEDGLAIAKKMPHLYFLLLEWLFQIDQIPSARPANSREVYNILNEIYRLQNDAMEFDKVKNMELTLRKFMIPQIWYQKNELHYWFTLLRIYALVTGKDVSSSFSDNFSRYNKISLDDFFILSLWVLMRISKEKIFISYERIVIELTPHYEIETIIGFFNIIGLNVSSIGGFFKNNEAKSVEPEYYFSDSILFTKPLFYLDQGIITPHKAFLARAISEFVLEKSKTDDHEKFRNKFSLAFENYLDIVLRESCLTYTREKETKKLYKRNNKEGKVVDFIVRESESTILIESKGTEPHRKILVSDNSRILRDRLKDSLLKGVEQVFECLSILLDCDEKRISCYEQRYSIIVTHQDYYISNVKKLNNYISSKFIENLLDKYGDIIPTKNIYFVSVENFEGIVNLNTEYNIQLSEFMSYCAAKDTNTDTSKFDIRQHINDFTTMKSFSRRGPIGSAYITKKREVLFQSLMSIVKNNQNYWRKGGYEHLEEYMQRYFIYQSNIRVGFDLDPIFVGKN